MKISADKLKSLDYKKLAINHAEKAVAGLIGLLIVLILFVPLFAGKYLGYKRTSDELTSQAAETKNKILESSWPEAEIIKYQGADDLSVKIVSLTSPVSPDLYGYSIEIAPPLYRKNEPRKEPDWLSVEGLLLVADRGQFEMPPKEDTEGLSSEGAEGIQTDQNGDTVIPLGQQDDQSDVPEKFRRKTGQRNAGAGGAVPGSTILDLGGAGYGDEQNVSPLKDELGGSQTIDYGGTGGGGYGETSETSGPILESRGHRYTLLTGVFNIRAQRERIAKALSLSEVALSSRTAMNSPAMRFDLLGFEVARKEGTAPWPEVDEDRQILDINRSMDVLMGMAGFDFDPVTYSVTHQQITSPLPPRIVGEWGDDVAHPKISNYVLNTEDGKELNKYLTEYLAEQEDKNQKLRDRVAKDTRYGFAPVQRNMQGLSKQLLGGGNNQSGIKDFAQDYLGSGNSGTQQASGGRANGKKQKQIESEVDRITAAGTLLLFRYFDFDVEPGKSYQYRVRLIFENPNFNIPVSELEDPQSRLGEIRKTPWSKLAQPITVLKDTEYFLTKVLIPAGKKSEESRLLMYQWRPDIGTVVSNVLDSKLGQYIGGKMMTEVLKPAEQKFVTENVEFTSNDVLVDSSQGFDINYKDHADLNFPKRLTGKGRLRIMDEALVQDASGRLFAIDPFSSSKAKQGARQRFDWQNQPWQFLKEQLEDDDLGVGGVGDDAGTLEMGASRGGTKKRRESRRSKSRRKSKLKKKSRKSGN